MPEDSPIVHEQVSKTCFLCKLVMHPTSDHICRPSKLKKKKASKAVISDENVGSVPALGSCFNSVSKNGPLSDVTNTHHARLFR